MLIGVVIWGEIQSPVYCLVRVLVSLIDWSFCEQAVEVWQIDSAAKAC